MWSCFWAKMHLKGSKNLKKNTTFKLNLKWQIAQNPLLPKTKTPFKANLLFRTKTLPSILLCSLEDDVFIFVNKNILRVYFKFMQQKSVKYWHLFCHQKKPSKKVILDKTKTSLPRFMESPESDVFRFLKIDF